MKRLLPLAVLLLVVMSACARDAGSASGEPGTIRGTVLLGPTCPVETMSSPCPDEPLPDVVVRVLRQGEPVDEVTSGDGGVFEISVPAGSYTLDVEPTEGGPGMFSKPVDVSVAEGETVEVTLLVDTGIR